MISQRLRGVKEDGEAIEEEGFMPKLKQAFGDVGIAIEDQNGELRSTYDILNDLAGKWDQLSSKQRQYLGEKAAGNRQVKTLNAIMSNWDVVQDTIQKANEATGEAAQGNEKYLDSIEGRVTQFKSAFQDLARTTIDSGFVKSLVSIGTGFINITKNAGGLVPVATTLLGLVMSFKGVKIIEGIQKLVPALSKVFSLMSSGQGVIKSFMTLFSTPVGAVGGILTLVGVIAAVASTIKNSIPSVKEMAAEAKQSYSDQKTKVENLNEELKNTQSLINDLSSKGHLTIVESDELSRLEKTNAQLERQIALEKARLKITQQEARESASDAGKKYNTTKNNYISDTSIDYLGIQGVADILGYNREVISDEQIVDTMISTQEMYKLQSEQLIKSKQDYNEALIEFNSTSLEDVETLTLLEERMKVADKAAQEAQKWLNTYLSELQSYTEGIERVENPTNKKDEYYNDLLDLQEEVEDLILTSDMFGMSSGDQLNLILAKYQDAAEAAKNIVEEFGEITVDDLGAEAFEGMMAKFDELGWSADNVAKHLTEFYSVANDGKDAVNSLNIENLIKNNFLASESYKNLTAAMSEQQKAGAISLETYKKLIDDKEGLPGIANYLTLTADGFALNTEALYDYIKAQTDEQKLKALQEYEDKTEAIAKLTSTIQHYQQFGLDVSKEQALLEQYNQEKDALAAYVRELDSAANALARYKAAKSTPNEDEDYNTGQEAFKDIQEGWKSGKVGTDDYQEAMRFMLGSAYGTTLTGKQAKDAATKLGNRYFKDEKTGTKNFLSDLEKTDLVTKDINGNLSLKEGTTLKQVAESLSDVTGNAEMSESAVESLFKLLNTYSETKFEFPEVITPEEQAEIDKRKKELEALDKSQEDVNKKIEETDKKIQEASGKGEDTTQLEKQRNDLQKVSETIAESKAKLEEGTTANIDTMSIEDAQKRIQELSDTIAVLSGSGLDIPVTLKGEYDALLEKLKIDLKTIENDGSNPKVTVESQQAETKLGSIEEKLDEVGTGADAPLYAHDDGANSTIDDVNDELAKIKNGADASLTATDNTSEGIQDAQGSINGIETDPININAVGTAAKSVADQTANYIEGLHPTITISVIGPDGETYSFTEEEEKAYQELLGGNHPELAVPMPHVEPPTNIPEDALKYLDGMNTLVQSVSGQSKDQIGKTMQAVFGQGGSVDLTNRPQVPAEKMREAGWDVEDGKFSTVLSQSVNVGENGEIGVVLTPIMPDGQVITPENMGKIFENLFIGPDGNINLADGDYGIEGLNLSDILISSMDMTNMSDSIDGRAAILEGFGDYLSKLQEKFYSGDFDPLDIPVQPDAETEGGEKDWKQAWLEAWNAGSPVEVPVEPEAQEEPSWQNVPPPPMEEPIEVEGFVEWQNLDPPPEPEPIDVEADTESYVEQIETATPESETININGKVDVVEPTNSDVNTTSTVTQTVNVDTSGAQSKVDALEDSAEAGVTKPINADGTNALNEIKQIDDAAKKPITKRVTIQTSGVLPYATGTKGAPKGPALVDDGGGAELIEHVSRGTYELGTDNGPRMTYLDNGDVVHTAKETKTILSRMAKVGGFFRDGLNKGKSIIGKAFAKGISGSISLENINRVLNSARNGKSSSVAKSKGKGLSSKKLSAWAEKLFDWAEVRLERLKTITNSWLLSASEAIGYIAKNNELASAIRSVEDEIEATSKAYDLYIKQADTVAQKAKLSNDIVQKIQNGTIEIASYKKEVQEKIKLYQEWYNKALNCVDALSDLREQEKELARQRLDNIIDHYTNRVNRLDNVVRQRESELELATAEGTEIHASDYDKSIDATTQKLKELVEERNTLEIEMEQLMSQGFIEKESDEWYEYQGKLDDVTNAITETKTAIIELADTANEVNITKLGYQLDALTNSAAAATGMMDLHSAQGLDELPDAYAELIVNGMQQIEILERENEGYREQQKNLDVLSEKYQDLESKIQSNLSAINSMKVSQEGWNDSVLELKISQLEKFRDKLSKTNDQYERQKQLQEAIEDLQRAQDQRTNKVFKEGIGFVFEADQDALKDAQENLESVIQDQLISRIDDLIDALNEEKNNTNVYDAQGNLLGTEYVLPQLESLSQILSDYYNSNTVPLYSGLKGSLYDQIIEGATSNKSMQFTFGDINLSEVNDVETLGAAIVDLLPNAILQAINKK